MSLKKTISYSIPHWFLAFPPFFMEMSFYRFFWKVMISKEFFLFVTRHIPMTPSIAPNISSGGNLSLHPSPQFSASPTGVT